MRQERERRKEQPGREGGREKKEQIGDYKVWLDRDMGD